MNKPFTVIAYATGRGYRSLSAIDRWRVREAGRETNLRFYKRAAKPEWSYADEYWEKRAVAARFDTAEEAAAYIEAAKGATAAATAAYAEADAAYAAVQDARLTARVALTQVLDEFVASGPAVERTLAEAREQETKP